MARLTRDAFNEILRELRKHEADAGILAQKIKDGNEPASKLPDAILALEQGLRAAEFLLEKLAEQADLD